MKNPLETFSFTDPFSTWWPFIVAGLFGLVTTIRSYIAGPKCPNEDRMTNKIVVLTGGSSGVGLEVAKELIKRGAHVILGARNPQTTEEMLKKLFQSNQLKETYNWKVSKLDLSSMSSIQNFVNSINEHHIDVLINNAGICSMSYETNDQGIEKHFAVNYLGHFALTLMLLPKLRASDSARVINTAAQVHPKVSLNLKTISEPNGYSSNMAFARSKLAVLLITVTLASMWKGNKIAINAVNPGLVRGTGHRSNSILSRSIYFRMMAAPTAWLLMKTPEQASQTIVYLAVIKDPSVTGKYFSNCSEMDFPGSAKDLEKGKQLYKFSLRLIKMAQTDHMGKNTRGDEATN